MPLQIFINLPVRDIEKATAFYAAIGATRNPQFSDESTSCMVLSDTVFVMVHTYTKWGVFTRKPIADARRQSETMLALSATDRQSVDRVTDAAAANGGKADVNPKQDHGFMYGRSFEDPDGHIWESVYVDMTKMPKQG